MKKEENTNIELNSEKVIKKIVIKYMISFFGLLILVVLSMIKPAVNGTLTTIYSAISLVAVIIISLMIPTVLNYFGDNPMKNKVISFTFNLSDFFSIFIVACCACQCFFTFAFFRAEVDGRSMYPALLEEDVIIGRSTTNVDNFDIVIFQYKEKYISDELKNNYTDLKDGELLVKRLIGKGGDTFKYVNGILYLNNEKIDEEYLPFNLSTEPFFSDYTNGSNLSHFDLSEWLGEGVIEKDGVYIIEEGYYFIMGDNRTVSLDSRVFGLFRESQLVGKVAYRVNSLLDLEKVE